jgi:phosphatidylserine/phosphatidylglycerophosphate/cardiolipin synthase-like enzyme
MRSPAGVGAPAPQAIVRNLRSALSVAIPLAAMALLFWIFQREAAPAPALPGRAPAAEGAVAILFTAPDSPSAGTYRGGPDEALREAIDEASETIDLAVYDFNLWSLRDALLRAADRGVRVRVVTDSDNILRPEVAELEEAGIPVLGDRREPLMHHKFTVIDGDEVWSGSMNYTVTDAYLNDNNLIRIRSAELAASYTREFEEMFIEDRFGALSLGDTPQREMTVDGVRLEVYFSPDDGAAARIGELIRGAEDSIDFLAFSFTLDSLAEAMIERAVGGVEVRGVFEEGQSGNIGSRHIDLLGAGIDVRLDGNPRNMHHKVIVIDEAIVITGSYNFSTSAEESNDENVLILWDERVASLFLIEFERVFSQAAP